MPGQWTVPPGYGRGGRAGGGTAQGRGEDGEDGEDGKDGEEWEDGEDGEGGEYATMPKDNEFEDLQKS